MHRILLIAFVFLFLGCASEPRSTGVVIDLFDTKTYLAEEFKGSSQRDITKTISYNAEVEVITIKDYNLDGDIEVLSKANINNPSWADKYIADTLDMGGGRIDIVYTSVDPKLQIKKMTVSKDQDRVIGFEAYRELDALISSSTKLISYNSDKGYRISTKSKNLISPERTIAIDVQF